MLWFAAAACPASDKEEDLVVIVAVTETSEQQTLSATKNLATMPEKRCFW